MRTFAENVVVRGEKFAGPIRLIGDHHLTLIECEIDGEGAAYSVQANEWQASEDGEFKPVGRLTMIGGSVRGASKKLMLAHRFSLRGVTLEDSDEDAIFVDRGRRYWVDGCTFRRLAQKKDFDPNDPSSRPHGEALQDPGGIPGDKSFGFVSRNTLDLSAGAGSPFANSGLYFETSHGRIGRTVVWENRISGGQYGIVAKDEPGKLPYFGHPRIRIQDNAFDLGSFGSGPLNASAPKLLELFGNVDFEGKPIGELS